MNPTVLEDAIRGMDRRKVNDDVTSAAKSGLDAAAGIGTETPMVVLNDIRRCIMEFMEVVRDREIADQNRETAAERRHNELVATLQQLAVKAAPQQPTFRRSMSRDSIGSMSTTSEKRTFYDHETKITTGAQIVAVVLMKLDHVLQNSGQIPAQESNDSIILDLKGWSSPILIVAPVASIVTGNNSKLELPKPSQAETIAALEVVSSTVQGQGVAFRVSDVVRLQQQCAGLIGIVDEVRQRLVKCPGFLPEGKRLRLSCLQLPYANRNDELNVVIPQGSYVKASPAIAGSVPKFSHAAKKVYASEVLEKGTAPIVAFNRANKVN